MHVAQISMVMSQIGGLYRRRSLTFNIKLSKSILFTSIATYGIPDTRSLHHFFLPDRIRQSRGLLLIKLCRIGAFEHVQADSSFFFVCMADSSFLFVCLADPNNKFPSHGYTHID
jgi:hypothetical protein